MAIARRAFELFESHGSGAHEREDWRQAESALLRPICVGRMSVDDSFWISTDTAPFKENTVNIWVAPRRLTICGQPGVKKEATSLRPPSPQAEEEMLFRVVELPVEIDPSNVTGKFRGRFLEILLKKAHPKPEHAASATAA
ncbi:MAG: Hsp20/alpha crystallin family protein [Candidatus Acidiferrum sp.]